MKIIISFLNAKIMTTFLIITFICITGCKKGENGITNPEDNSSPFSFSGEISVLIDSLTYHELVNVSFTQGSEITGSYFQLSDGLTGLFEGSKSGNKYQIAGSFANNIPGNFNGSITLKNDDEIDFEINGTINNEPFQSTGLLNHISCINLAGKYLGEEEATITIEIEGEKETETISGMDYIYVEEQNCKLDYTVPGTATSREGEIIGNQLTFSGVFVIPNEGLVLTKNEFHAEVTISDNYHYEFRGEGIAEGTYQGHKVKITGNSKGELFKQFDVALGILRGGPLGIIIPPEMTQIQNQVLSKYPTQVIVKCFKTGNQIKMVNDWLNDIVNNLKNYNINAILVGHSLGADAIRIGDFSNYNLYSRVFIDPINPNEFPPLKLQGWEEAANQRELTFPIEHYQGYAINYLAKTMALINGEESHGLLGHHIAQADEYPEDNTNHMTIVDRMIEKKYVLEQVDKCIDQLNKNENRIATSNPKSFSLIKNLEINSIFNYKNK